MKKFVKNPWILGIGTTVIGGVLLTSVLDGIKRVEWLSTFKLVIKFIVSALTAFLNLELKVWCVLVAAVCIFVVLLIISKALDAKTKNSALDFLNYTTDSLLGYTWEWEYIEVPNGKYTINNLHPVCSECRMVLKQGGMYGTEMKCLRCNTTKNWENTYFTDARMLIEDNIKKKYSQNQ